MSQMKTFKPVLCSALLNVDRTALQAVFWNLNIRDLAAAMFPYLYIVKLSVAASHNNSCLKAHYTV